MHNTSSWQNRRQFIRFGIALSATALCTPSWSQTASFPQKSIRIVVPFAPGTGSDVIARTVGQKITEETKQSVLVENREGGGGIVGTNAVLQAPADGYTLLMVANPFTIVAGTNLQAPYDPLKDFSPVAKVAIVPIILTMTNELPIHSVKDLVAYAKANPGKLSYASSGAGTPSQIEMELFKQATGIDIVEVPYKSTAQAMTDVIGGQIAMYPAAAPLCLPHINSKRVRAIALFDEQRSASLPDIPTFPEALNIPGYSATPLWYGFVARAGAPIVVMQQLHALVTQAMRSKEVNDRLVALGAQPIQPTNEEFTAQMAGEIEKARKIAKELGMLK